MARSPNELTHEEPVTRRLTGHGKVGPKHPLHPGEHALNSIRGDDNPTFGEQHSLLRIKLSQYLPALKHTRILRVL